MPVRNTSTIEARRRARERLAHERAEQAERNKANEADLVEYLLLEQCIDAADTEYETTVSAAQQRRENDVAQLCQRQAECVRRMSGRGEVVAQIADRTGMSQRDVRKIIKTPVANRTRNARHETVGEVSPSTPAAFTLYEQADRDSVRKETDGQQTRRVD